MHEWPLVTLVIPSHNATPKLLLQCNNEAKEKMWTSFQCNNPEIQDIQFFPSPWREERRAGQGIAWRFKEIQILPHRKPNNPPPNKALYHEQHYFTSPNDASTTTATFSPSLSPPPTTCPAHSRTTPTHNKLLPKRSLTVLFNNSLVPAIVSPTITLIM